MNISLREAVALTLVAASCSTHAQDFSGQTLETVLITAKRDDRVSKGATGLNMHVRVNGYNLSDEKYITSLYQIGYYAAPRSYEVGLGYRF